MKKPHPPAHASELNLVPYLDVTVNLVMFLLVSLTTASFAVVPVNAPEFGDRERADTPGPRPTLGLEVSVGRDGFHVVTRDGHPASVIPCVGGKCGPESYDFARLTGELAALKKARPDATEVILAAEPAVSYEVVIRTMDATRGSKEAPLFPEVTLAAVRP